MESEWVEVDVATGTDCAFEVDGAEGAIFVFWEFFVADEEAATAGENLVWGHDIVFQATDCGDYFEGGGWRVEALSGAVDPGSSFVDFIEDGCWDVGGEFVLVVGGAACHSEDFAGFDLDCYDGAASSFEGGFCSFLNVDIDACG